MKAKEKKARGKNAAVASTGAATEIVNNVSEIDQATARHNAEQQETAAAIAGANLAPEVAQEQVDGKPAEPQKKPVEPKHLLTEEAHKLRKQLVNDPRRRRYAAETAVTNYFTAKGYSPEGKQVTKADLVAYMQEMESAPEATNSRMFSDEAFQKIVKHFGHEVKSELFKRFDKQTGVGITDELLMAVAESAVVVDKDLNLEIDGDFAVCVIESCAQRFVPLRGTNSVTIKGRVEFKGFGNFLYVEPNKKNGLAGPEMWPHCRDCKNDTIDDARANGQRVYFLSQADAQNRVQDWLDRDKRREERSFSIGAAVQSRDARNDERVPRKPAGKFDPALEAKCQNSFAALLNNREKDHPTGRYYSPEFEWKDKFGKVYKTFLDLIVTKWNLVVSNAGSGLEFLIDTTHNTGYFENKALFVALNKAADAQQQ